MTELHEKIKLLPAKPGVYLFKNSTGTIIYVGKAINLRNRVRSYFVAGADHLPKTEIMIPQIADLEYIVVTNEAESLILEDTLIKKHQPRFNVKLRDDKDYQFIKIDYNFEIPQIYTVRTIETKGARYFGPYTSGLAVRHTLRLIKQIFFLCRNKKVTGKPCFAYHLGRCGGVCFGVISVNAYRERLHEVEKFLRHEQSAVIKDLQKQMKLAAATKKFERAAAFRDKLRALRQIWEKQKIITTRNDNHDYLGLHLSEKQAVVVIMMVRHGRLASQEHFTLDHNQASAAEILERFISRYYTETSDLPKIILTPAELPNQEALQKALRKFRKSALTIIKPQRGRRAKLVQLASENAALQYEQQKASFERRLTAALPQLQALLRLPRLPQRIEGYDISNIQGTNPVGSMVVFQDGRPAKNEYRKFKINIKQTPDDFAMMAEMLQRRFAHLNSLSPRGRGQGEGGTKDIWPTPDLIIIDGGKGQLNVAVRVLKNYNLKLPVIGLAKRLEEIFLPGEKIPIMLPPDSPILFLLQQIRDEAHRFAITFHRHRRATAAVTSRLDDVPGIGPKLRKKLLTAFGDVAAIKQASVDELAQIVGPKLAQKIKEQI